MSKNTYKSKIDYIALTFLLIIYYFYFASNYFW